MYFASVYEGIDEFNLDLPGSYAGLFGRSCVSQSQLAAIRVTDTLNKGFLGLKLPGNRDLFTGSGM